MTQKTHTVLVLDQSGSMEGRRASAVANYNEQVQQARLNSKEDHEITLGCVTFNGDLYEHSWLVPAEQVPFSTDEDYRCVGGTALNDALGYVIEKLLATTDQNDPNTAYLIQVVTDGEENSSRMYSRFDPERKLAKLVERVQATERWTISFIGCDANYLAQLAKETAVPIGNMGTTAPAQFLNAAAAQSANVNAYYGARSGGATASKGICRSAGLGKEVLTSGGIVMDFADVPVASSTTSYWSGISSSTCCDDAGGTAQAPVASAFQNHQVAAWSFRNPPDANS